MPLPVKGKPSLSEVGQPEQLEPVHRLDRWNERGSPAGLHFNEDEAVTVMADQVDLAVPGAGVPRDDPHPPPHQLRLRRALPGITEQATGVWHGRHSARP